MNETESEMRPWILAETNYSHAKDCHYDVAVLPMGATEPHNLHLPYGTDTFQADLICERACGAAWNSGARVVMLPTIPYGTETNMSQCAMAINVNPTTLGNVIRDIAMSLAEHGVKKLLILNGHGGNDFKPLLRELMGQVPLQMFLCDWFRGLTSDVMSELFDEPGNHAGAAETSLGLAFFSHLVKTKADGAVDADDGAVRKSRIDAINKGWLSISRPWHLLTTNTGSGNPHDATAEKGERLMEVIVDRLSRSLMELASADVDDDFPF